MKSMLHGFAKFANKLNIRYLIKYKSLIAITINMLYEMDLSDTFIMRVLIQLFN